ncbi:hypothetical protein HYH03_012849 [Edaphochlamys debaryana]|uniref:Uncharacterized protein n=1 Tax=Edaphochlamys debaryana TaxID=47281 RepID=A0A836BV16_9CHLO|nr:hypothetical protein HYH03_012849 [Edaphochlamys debaryana]|eukprot:KAG2488529.1 hypothetical protein HYH03_012849 [Edaphochlamys debaryana]
MLEPLLAAARAERYVKAQRQHVSRRLAVASGAGGCCLIWVSSAFKTLVRSQPARHVVTAVLPVLAYLGASLTDSETLTDAFWALSYIAENRAAEARSRPVRQAGTGPTRTWPPSSSRACTTSVRHWSRIWLPRRLSGWNG